jgi:soluble lytic murein transglycosylase-like protein
MVRSPGSVGQESPGRPASPAADGPAEDEPVPSSPTPAPEEPKDRPAPPGPHARLPRDASSAALALERTHRALDDLTERWLKQGARPGTPIASDLELWALFQQRLYRGLAKMPGPARRTIARLPRSIAGAARANLGAQSDLYDLNQPVRPPIKLPQARPAPPDELLRFYKQAGRTFGVPWYVLASVNFVETRFGRLKGPSSAGALGPMQFLPSTWDQYGNGGDIFDPRDAIFGAARYLAASGAPNDMRGALYAYNNSDLYVNAILDYALQMRKDPRDFYAYYNWQVFVRTTKGDVQLTGPGKD